MTQNPSSPNTPVSPLCLFQCKEYQGLGLVLEQAIVGLKNALDVSAITLLGVFPQELQLLMDLGYKPDDHMGSFYLTNHSLVQKVLSQKEPVWGSNLEEKNKVLRHDESRYALFWPVLHRGKVGGILVLEAQTLEPSQRWILTLSTTQSFWENLLTEIILESEKAKLAAQIEQHKQEFELAQREIQQLNEELSNLRKTKEQFLAHIGYELRTPLTSLLGFCEILLDQSYGPLSPNQVNFLESMQMSGQRLLRMVNDLVHLTQLERGNDSLIIREFHIEHLFKTLESEFSEIALQHGISFSVTLDSELGVLSGDEERLKQVLFQLLDNAFKFTPRGGKVELSAAATYGVGGEEGCEIAVQDTGIGIAPEDRQRVFQDFAQIDESSSRSHPGLGIGLSIAQRIIYLHGSRLALESSPNQGSRFFFILPRNTFAVARRVPVILIIENDPETCELLKMILTRNGFDTEIFHTAESAIDHLEQTSESGINPNLPDVILLDILLPQMNGFDLCKHLRTREDTRHIPIIMLSVFQNPAEKLRGLEMGATDFLIKPVNRKELLARIKSLVTQKREYEHILKEYSRAQRLAITDGLTGLFNHTYLVEELARQIQHTRETEQPLSVIMLDVDWFKHFNDTNGHLAGNEVLKNLALVMEQSFRREDLLARYGGEEFAILLPNTSKDQAVQLAERLRKRVAEYPFPACESQPLGCITISLGVACFPSDTQDESQVIEFADRALYQAKQQGRNRVCIWQNP